eukprot:PITA_16426
MIGEQFPCLLMGCFFLLLLLQIKLSDAEDAASSSIVLGASLTSDETGISKNGIFKLGFFNLTNNNVKKWHVEDRSLLLSYGGSIFWSSEANGKKPSSAVIMDSGNLVVVSAENASEYISFDHPGNMWFPGMKISVRQRLTSWRDPWDPSPGPFTLQMDPNGANQYVLLWKNHIKYWESGVWKGRIFRNVVEMSSNYMYNFGFYNNGSYKYFTYSVMHGFTELSRFVMDQSGEIRVSITLENNDWSMIWKQPRDQCNVYAACGPYGLCNTNNVQSCNCVADFIPKNRRECYRALQNATKNFSERLGGGGFGSVFKGTLTDSSLVAVKKLEGVSQGEKQFRVEVSTIGTAQHINLVRLQGFCTEGSSALLVYEYMPNGSLNSLLFHKTRNNDQIETKLLDWKTRFSIALGTAWEINYLHEKSKDCIIHCDIKPENILLDSNFCPKLVDFGLAKLLGREYSKVLTTMRGTRGYMAPKWLFGLPITTKADVYSFGMTQIEIIASRRNVCGVLQSNELFFPTWVVMQINRGNDMEVLKKKLMGNADAKQVKRAAIMGGWCIQDDEDTRPSMNQVV